MTHSCTFEQERQEEEQGRCAIQSVGPLGGSHGEVPDLEVRRAVEGFETDWGHQHSRDSIIHTCEYLPSASWRKPGAKGSSKWRTCQHLLDGRGRGA